MKRNEALAIAKVLKGRMASVKEEIAKAAPGAPQILFPASAPPTIVNEVAVPQVTVNVDVASIVTAVRELFDIMNAMVKQNAALLEHLMKQRPIEVNPSFTVPVPVVNVAAPVVNLPEPKPTQRPAKLTIQHDDGSESIITAS